MLGGVFHYKRKCEEIESLKKDYEEKRLFFEKKNEEFNEKEHMLRNEEELVQRLLKNPEMFYLINDEILGGVFDVEKQMPIKEIEREKLKSLYEKVKGEEISSTNRKSLKRLIDQGDFEDYYYFVEAWY